MNNVFLNVYTNGLDKSTCKVVLIEALKTDLNFNIIDSFRGIVKPAVEFDYQEELNAVNGITREEIVLNGKSLDEVFAQFCEFAANSTLIGHNISRFGIPVLYMDLQRDCIVPAVNLWKQPIIDTFSLSRTIPDTLHSREDLRRHYNIEFQNVMNEILSIYKHLIVDVEDNELIANKLSPDGWLSYDGSKIRFSKGKYAGWAITSTAVRDMQDYINRFIFSVCCPRTKHTLLHLDALYQRLSEMKKN